MKHQFSNPYFTRKKGSQPANNNVTFNNNSPIKAVLRQIDVSDLLKETMPRAYAPKPTEEPVETPLYLND